MRFLLPVFFFLTINIYGQEGKNSLMYHIELNDSYCFSRSHVETGLLDIYDVKGNDTLTKYLIYIFINKPEKKIDYDAFKEEAYITQINNDLGCLFNNYEERRINKNKGVLTKVTFKTKKRNINGLIFNVLHENNIVRILFMFTNENYYEDKKGEIELIMKSLTFIDSDC